MDKDQKAPAAQPGAESTDNNSTSTNKLSLEQQQMAMNIQYAQQYACHTIFDNNHNPFRYQQYYSSYPQAYYGYYGYPQQQYANPYMQQQQQFAGYYQQQQQPAQAQFRPSYSGMLYVISCLGDM